MAAKFDQPKFSLRENFGGSSKSQPLSLRLRLALSGDFGTTKKIFNNIQYSDFNILSGSTIHK